MKFMDRTKLIPVLLVLLLLCGLVPASCAESVSPAYDISRLNYELVWADEFDTDGLPDPSRWDSMSVEAAGETESFSITCPKAMLQLKTGF